MPASSAPLTGDPLLVAVTDAMVALHEPYHHRAPVTAKTLMLDVMVSAPPPPRPGHGDRASTSSNRTAAIRSSPRPARPDLRPRSQPGSLQLLGRERGDRHGGQVAALGDAGVCNQFGIGRDTPFAGGCGIPRLPRGLAGGGRAARDHPQPGALIVGRDRGVAGAIGASQVPHTRGKCRSRMISALAREQAVCLGA